MVYLIAGDSHTGKTLLAQRLMERQAIPYLSIDHIKMGLIRSGMIQVDVYEDEQVMAVVWPIIKEIIKTVIENHQHIIIEGCYIPFTWKQEFTKEEVQGINYICLIFHEQYLIEHSSNITDYENVIEHRLTHEPIKVESLIKKHERQLALCKQYDLSYLLIQEEYEQTIDDWLHAQTLR